jgi:hypothetical protein
MELEFVTRLRTNTEKLWPDLWGWPGDTKAQSNDRALALLRKIQSYLRQAWNSRDPYARDWFLLRARLWHYRHLIQLKTEEQREAVEAVIEAADRGQSDARTVRSELELLHSSIDRALDEPPPRTGFLEALNYLHQVAPAKLRFCPAPECQQPYFIANRKGQEYCGAPECVNYGQRKAKKKWWLEHGRATQRKKK